VTIFIIQTGEPLEIDNDNYRPMRAINLSKRLGSDKIKFLLLSSKFKHSTKTHRIIPKSKLNKSSLKTVLLNSPGYKSNISFGRIIDHTIMSMNLASFLFMNKIKPKLVFIGYPPIETSFVFCLYCKIKKIPYILDIKDLWPFIFIDHVPSPFKKLFSVALYPYIKMARFCAKNSNFITAPSVGYIKKIRKLFNLSDNKKILLFPLSSNLESSNCKAKDLSYIKSFLKEKNNLTISFAGSLMKSAYDFNVIEIAIKELVLKGYEFNFVIAGDGEIYKDLQKLFSKFKNVVFTGWLDQSKLNALYKVTDAIIAPYKNNTNYDSHIPNKVYDSLKAHKPLITSLRGDIDEIIKSYRIGFTYENQEPSSLTKIIKNLIVDKNLCSEISNNIKNNITRVLPKDEAYIEILNLYKSL